MFIFSLQRPFVVSFPEEFPKAMIRLVTNPIYVLTVFAICSDWSALGFMLFMPKYLEVQFQQTASVANLLGGRTFPVVVLTQYKYFEQHLFHVMVCHVTLYSLCFIGPCYWLDLFKSVTNKTRLPDLT